MKKKFCYDLFIAKDDNYTKQNRLLFYYIPCVYFAHDYRNRPFCSPAFFRKINGSLTRSVY